MYFPSDSWDKFGKKKKKETKELFNTWWDDEYEYEDEYKDGDEYVCDNCKYDVCDECKHDEDDLYDDLAYFEANESPDVEKYLEALEALRYIEINKALETRNKERFLQLTSLGWEYYVNNIDVSKNER